MSSLINRSLALPIFVFSFIAACQGPVESSRQELIETFAALDKSVQEGDLDTFVSFYADSAFHLPPGAPRNASRAEISEFLQGTLGLYEIVGEPEIQFSGDASMAFLYGEYEISADEARGIEAFDGRFISVWRKGRDGWKCVVDIWNTANPDFEHL